VAEPRSTRSPGFHFAPPWAASTAVGSATMIQSRRDEIFVAPGFNPGLAIGFGIKSPEETADD
jgi:hypothetical protein